MRIRRVSQHARRAPRERGPRTAARSVSIDKGADFRPRRRACVAISATRIRPDEIATGDLGSIDADGYVYVHGRLKNMFITSIGRNVSPEWVEGELACDPPSDKRSCSAKPPRRARSRSPRAAGQQTAIERAVEPANERLPDYARVRALCACPSRSLSPTAC